MPTPRAVVLVSGGDAVTPYTTPEQGCSVGLAAGNTCTALRAHLLGAGLAVYTAPAMNARTEVVDPDPGSFGAFGGAPEVLGAHMTIISNADIDNAGEHLAHSANYLHRTRGVRAVDWVGHSNGGLYARAAARILRDTASPVRTGSLLTLGTPWMGSVPFRVVFDELPESALLGNQVALDLVAAMREEVKGDLGLAREQLYTYLLGPNGWNAAQASVLDDIPVRMIGGTYLADPTGDQEVWPFDGLVSEHSALGRGLPDSLVPDRQTASYPLTHSIYISAMLGLPWDTALTWNADVLGDVTQFIESLRPRQL